MCGRSRMVHQEGPRRAGPLQGGSRMSQTLNLVASLLATARDLQAAGRNQAAIDLLQRLAAYRQLSREVAEDVHGRLADLHAELEQYPKARRHLTIALTFRPQHAAYHHRMGRWI